jgi:hypothetical protein
MKAIALLTMIFLPATYVAVSQQEDSRTVSGAANAFAL